MKIIYISLPITGHEDTYEQRLDDAVEYVKEHLIDTTKYDVICQDTSFPVHISLAVMAQCKHFIIGNTTFGWWAQYLCTNPEKIVMAPSRWYGTPVPCDIYQDNWTLIEV